MIVCPLHVHVRSCVCRAQAEQKTLAGILGAHPEKTAGVLSSILHVLNKQAEKRLLSLTGTSQRLLGEYVKLAEPKVCVWCRPGQCVAERGSVTV